MNNLEVIKYPNPVLKKKAEEVKEITPEIRKLIEEMVSVLRENKGIGLAAPQVGVSKRIIVFESGNGIAALINPKIIKSGKKQFIDIEGCLSFPDIWIKIKRSERIEVEAQDLLGRKIQMKASMMVSRVLQHELDHLDGMLFIDKINFIDKLKIRDKLNKLKNKYDSNGTDRKFNSDSFCLDDFCPSRSFF